MNENVSSKEGNKYLLYVDTNLPYDLPLFALDAFCGFHIFCVLFFFVFFFRWEIYTLQVCMFERKLLVIFHF